MFINKKNLHHANSQFATNFVSKSRVHSPRKLREQLPSNRRTRCCKLSRQMLKPDSVYIQEKIDDRELRRHIGLLIRAEASFRRSGDQTKPSFLMKLERARNIYLRVRERVIGNLFFIECLASLEVVIRLGIFLTTWIGITRLKTLRLSGYSLGNSEY